MKHQVFHEIFLPKKTWQGDRSLHNSPHKKDIFNLPDLRWVCVPFIANHSFCRYARRHVKEVKVGALVACLVWPNQDYTSPQLVTSPWMSMLLDNTNSTQQTLSIQQRRRTKKCTHHLFTPQRRMITNNIVDTNTYGEGYTSFNVFAIDLLTNSVYTKNL